MGLKDETSKLVSATGTAPTKLLEAMEKNPTLAMAEGTVPLSELSCSCSVFNETIAARTTGGTDPTNELLDKVKPSRSVKVESEGGKVPANPFAWRFRFLTKEWVGSHDTPNHASAHGSPASQFVRATHKGPDVDWNKSTRLALVAGLTAAREAGNQAVEATTAAQTATVVSLVARE